jgi:3-hydroxyacyl-CoA dehydrogenase/3a,7a,12a-trihydroxy-5b-cholest-24-enoyl-CoA hydratase
MAMCTGKADAMKLFTEKKLRISGNILASQKLDFLRKIDPAAVLAAARARAGSAPAPAAPAAASPVAAVPAAAAAGRSSADVFAVIADHVEHNADLKKVGIVYLFKLTGPDSSWTVDLKEGRVAPGETAKPECTLTLSDADFLDMTNGKADAMKLFMDKKLRIAGNVLASQKLDFLKKIDPEAAKKVLEKKAASSPAPAAIAAPAVDGRAWTVDLTTTPGSVREGADSKAACVLTVSDEDFVALCKGEQTAKSLYQHGQLKVDGDVHFAHKLGMLNKLV